MNVQIRGVHCEVPEGLHDYIDKKLLRLKHVEDLIVDLHLAITEEKKGGSTFEGHAHFRWGTIVHVSVAAFEHHEGIDKLFDKLEPTIDKEKERLQDHRD